MKRKIALQIHKKDIESLGTVRTLSYLRVAEAEDIIWIKDVPTENLDLKIRQLPAIASFEVDEEGLLFPIGKITPTGKLPDLNWQPIHEFVEVEFPRAAFSGKTDQTVWVKLVESEMVREGDALLTSSADWKAYAESASSIRLEKIRYAVAEHGEVLILGKPLIPIRGKTFWKNGNILLPNGYDFEFPVLSEIILQQYIPEKDGVLIFYKNGEWEKIQNSDFVKGSRSGVRVI
ncbi:MAG: hypothetical protein AAF573_06930 [Bacteroidota bacterium]